MATSDKDPRVDRVVKQYQWASKGRTPFEKKWYTWDKMYSSYRVLKADGRSNLFIPKPYELVETCTALLMGVAFPRRPYANFQARSGVKAQPAPQPNPNAPADPNTPPPPPTPQEIAEEATNFIDYQLNEQMKILLPMQQYLKNMVCYGTAFGKVGWRKEISKIRTREMQAQTQLVPGIFGIPMPKQVPVMVEIEKETATYDAPYFERISIWDAFPDPEESVGLRRRLPFIHRSIVTLSELKSYNRGEEPVYINLDEVAKLGSWNAAKNRLMSKSEMGRTDAPADPDNPLIELLEMTDQFGRRITTVANQQVCIRETDNPFYHGQLPIVSSTFSTDNEDCVFGTGIIEPGESLFFELNTIWNQVTDNISLALKAPFIADIDRLDDPDNVIFSCDNLIGVNGRPDDVIRKLDVPDYTGRAKDLIGLIMANMQSYSGITDIAKGTGTEGLGNDTASGMSMLLEQLNKRLAPIYMLFQETTMVPLLTQIRHLNHQFLDVGAMPSGEQVTFEHFKPEYQIECTGSVAYTSKVMRGQQAMLLFEKTLNHPNVNPVPLLRDMFLNAEYNADEIVITNPAPPPKEDPKYIFTLKSELTPEQSAQVLAENGIETTPEDLMGQNIERMDKIMAGHATTQRAMMGVGGPENNFPERGPMDEMARGAKQNANTGG